MKPKEIYADSWLTTEYDIADLDKQVDALHDNESIFINDHQILYTNGTFRVGTSFGDLVFDNADAAVNFCVRAGHPAPRLPTNNELDEVEKKLGDLRQRAERLESRVR